MGLSIPHQSASLKKHQIKPAGIAQLVEQRTENPRVTSSSLVPGISETNK